VSQSLPGFYVKADRYSKAIDPPKFEAMDIAWQTLLDLGIVEGEDQKSRLTALGRHVSFKKRVVWAPRS
jgi:HrpA-like RNA helicase